MKNKNLKIFKRLIETVMTSAVATRDMIEHIEELRKMYGFSNEELDMIIGEITDKIGK